MKEGCFVLNGFEALATTWYVEIFQDLSEEKEKEIKKLLEEFIVTFEHRYSRFRVDSLVSILNTKRVVPYDKHLACMLTMSKDITHKSDGVFNIFIHNKLVEKVQYILKYLQK